MAGKEGERTTLNASAQLVSSPASRPAHFVQAYRRERADQCKPRGQRKDQRQQIVAECQSRQDKPDQWVDDAEKDYIGAIGGEVVDAFGENFRESGDADPANRRARGMQIIAAAPGATSRFDGQGRVPELIYAPFDRISDGHDRSSRTLVQGPRATRGSTRGGLWSREAATRQVGTIRRLRRSVAWYLVVPT